MLAFFTGITVLIANAAHMKTVVLMLHDIMEWYITGEYGQVQLFVWLCGNAPLCVAVWLRGCLTV